MHTDTESKGEAESLEFRVHPPLPSWLNLDKTTGRVFGTATQDSERKQTFELTYGSKTERVDFAWSLVDGLRALTEQLSGHLSDWVKGLTLRALRAAVQKEAQEDAFTQATQSPHFVVSVPQWFQKAHARWQYPSGHAPYTKEFQVAAKRIQKVREINIVPDLRRVLGLN